MGTRLLTELSSPRVMSIMKNNKDLFKTNKNTVQILSRCIRKKKNRMKADQKVDPGIVAIASG